MHITVVYSPCPRLVVEKSFCVDDGLTVAQVLQASGLQDHWAQSQTLEVGIWGRKAQMSTPVGPHDRVEIYRPLTVDPQAARRRRFEKQGIAVAGLFAGRKAHPKASP